MKQTERRSKDIIAIECEMSLKEKLRILFSKKFVVHIDLSNDSDNGTINSEYTVLTLGKYII